jgi:hypothetical protein
MQLLQHIHLFTNAHLVQQMSILNEMECNPGDSIWRKEQL